MNNNKIERTSLVVDQKNLNKALNVLTRALAKYPLQPILNNIYIRIDKNKLFIGATDTSTTMSLCIDCISDNTGAITAPGKELKEIVSKMPKGELLIEIDDNYMITISSGMSSLKTKGTPHQNFPEAVFQIKNNTNIISLNIPLISFRKGLELVAYASDKKDTNSILNGVCFEYSEKGLELTATDGSRLSYYKDTNYTYNDDNQKIIIPFKTVGDIKKLTADIDDETIKINIDDNNDSSIQIITESRMLSANLIEGEYPKCQKLIPNTYINKAIVNRKKFLSSLERVAVLTNERSRVIKLLFEENNNLKLSANKPELGEFQDQIDLIGYEGSDFSIAFNVNYMIECLKSLSADEVQIEMTESLKPLIIRSIQDLNYDCINLLMPIQLKSY